MRMWQSSCNSWASATKNRILDIISVNITVKDCGAGYFQVICHLDMKL